MAARESLKRALEHSVRGSLPAGPEPNWTFAKDIQKMAFQLVDPPHSRTTWVQVHDRKLYAGSAYLNSPVGPLWKQWDRWFFRSVRDRPGKSIVNRL